MKQLFNKVVDKYKEQTPTVQGFIVLGILLIIGIIIRWNYIIEHVKAGFNYFNR